MHSDFLITLIGNGSDYWMFMGNSSATKAQRKDINYEI